MNRRGAETQRRKKFRHFSKLISEIRFKILDRINWIFRITGFLMVPVR